MINVAIYVPRQAVIEAVTPPYRIFHTANDFMDFAGKPRLFNVEYVGLEKEQSLGGGLYVIRSGKFIKDLEKVDLLIVPALVGDMEAAVAANEEAIPHIVRLHKAGAEVASLCLGAFLLAATGLLSGKRCSTHWAHYDQFRAMYSDVELIDGEIIIDEGSIYSSGGANSIWNFLVYLIEKYADRETAILLAKYFAIDIDRSSQNPFTIFSGQKKHTDEDIRKVQQYIEKNVEERFSIEMLAGKLSISRRSFERRFKQATNNSVLEYIQRIKMEAAKRSFEHSRKNISEVMYEVGYNDTKAFRSVFKKVTGLTPLEYKNKYNRSRMAY